MTTAAARQLRSPPPNPACTPAAGDLPAGPLYHDGLREALHDVVSRTWLRDAFQRPEPGRVPRRYQFFTDLVAANVIDPDGLALLRVNRLAGRLFLTDGAWSQARGGVFPYTDESEMLLTYLGREGLLYGVDTVLDIGAGCGHTVIAHPCDHKIAVDISARARSFIRVNVALNNTTAAFHRQDATQPLAPRVVDPLRPNTLIVGNLPFAVSPDDVSLPLAADGGRTGADVTLGALRAAAGVSGVTLVLLANSLYSTSRRSWQLVEQAREVVPSARIEWTLLRDVHVWRVNGTREQRNPMSVRRALPRKADCAINVLDHQRTTVRAAYKELAARLCASGWDRLGCGVLHVALP